MKGRFIAGVLAIVLGLSGCGVPETAEVISTSATTTAATSRMTTVAETTASTTTTSTTTTLPPETTPDTPFKDIEFTTDYRTPSNAAQKYTKNFSYTADDVTVYTEGVDDSLYVKLADSDDEPIFIEKHVDNIIFANGEITYTDDYYIKIYDLKTGAITLEFCDWGYNVSGMVRNSDKIAYKVIALLAGHETFTDLSVLDLNTMEIERIYTGYYLNVFAEGVTYDPGDWAQTILYDSFNFDIDGNLYYAVLDDGREDGFHKFTIYKRDFENKKTIEILTETSEIPFPTVFSDSVFISETDGMYYINQKGELIKLSQSGSETTDTPEDKSTHTTVDLSAYDLPVIDGSVSTVALEAAFVSEYTGLDFDSVKNSITHIGEDDAFERLYTGAADIVFVPYYRKTRIDAAKEHGINLVYEPVAFGIYRTREEFNYMDSGLVYYCLYYDKDTKNQSTLDFVEYILSSKGQAAVSKGGFSPISNTSLMAVEKPLYETLGTGEQYPENYKKSDKYSTLSFNRSNYSAPLEDHNRIEYFLLNGDLTNKELESKINDWIQIEILKGNLTYKFRDCVVFFIAVNGYLEVVISQTYGEGGGYMPDSPVSVWNLKTGERVLKLSDLFYKGTDFLTKLKKAYLNIFPERYASEIKTEPERFFITEYLYGDDSFYYIDDEYGGETTEDEYKLPINFLSEVMEFSPVWTYCDLTPYFTERHLDPDQWRHVRDQTLN